MQNEKRSEQLSLDGALPDPAQPALGPWARGSETSRQAALANYPHSGTQRRKVLDAIAASSGMTRDELCEQLGLGYESVDPRVVELVEAGWIVETNRTRQTRQGCSAKVLVLSDLRKAALDG